MTEAEIAEIVRGCTRFLAGHYPQKIQGQLRQIAESPFALLPRDGYGRGGMVSTLEAEVAELLGKEAAVFMPSGTMAQQIALRIWADESGNQAIAYHPTCHLEIHEQMAYRELHHLEAVLLGSPERLFTLEDLRAVDRPISSLLIELPQREIGGQLPSWQELSAICEYVKSRSMRLHMDGARLWECGPFFNRSYAEIAALFDSVYVSFYKILGGLPGAMLAGPAEFIEKARVWQRRHGGNLHQQSANAISAKLGIETHLPRLGEYVAKAQEIAGILSDFPQVRIVPATPPTNMMHIAFDGDSERLMEASLQIAREERVLLFSRLRNDGNWELTVGEAGLDLSGDKIRRLFQRLFQLAHTPPQAASG